MVLRILTSVNYGCVLVFGILLSAEISGGCETPRQKRLVAFLWRCRFCFTPCLGWRR